MNDTSRQRATLAGWLVCALGAIFYAYEYLLRIEPSVISHELMNYFAISYQGFGFLTGFYYFAYTPMQLAVGVITDLFGPKRVLTIAVALCALGSYLFAFPHNYVSPTATFYIACAGRFLVGFGSAFAFVGVLKLAAIWLPADRFALFSGLATALGMVGAMAGQAELTYLVAKVGWRDTIYLSAAFGVMLVPTLWFIIKDGYADFSHAFQQKALIKDVFQGLLKVARSRQIWLAGLIACCLYMSLAAFAESWGIQFIEHNFNVSQDEASSLSAVVFGGWLIGGPLAGLISDVFKSRKTPLLAGGVLSAAAISIILYHPNISYLTLWILLFSYGLFSSTEVICFSLGRENAPASASGTAIAFINMITMVSGMVFQPLIGLLVEWSESGFFKASAQQLGISSYQLSLFVLPLAAIVATILLIFLRETHAEPIYDGNASQFEEAVRPSL